jgi:hypothetical protein
LLREFLRRRKSHAGLVRDDCWGWREPRKLVREGRRLTSPDVGIWNLSHETGSRLTGTSSATTHAYIISSSGDPAESIRDFEANDIYTQLFYEGHKCGWSEHGQLRFAEA